jgi:tRNA(fMet)-specific endonuclease VapC
MLVLDTDHMTLVEWAGNSPEANHLFARLDQAGTEEVVTTIISFEEQTRGWLAYAAKARTVAQQIEAYRKLNRHLDAYRPMRVLDFDDQAAAKFQHLLQAHLRIGTMDLKIAAIVLAQDATLLSRNLSDFGKVPGLKVKDWSA